MGYLDQLHEMLFNIVKYYELGKLELAKDEICATVEHLARCPGKYWHAPVVEFIKDWPKHGYGNRETLDGVLVLELVATCWAKRALRYF